MLSNPTPLLVMAVVSLATLTFSANRFYKLDTDNLRWAWSVILAGILSSSSLYLAMYLLLSSTRKFYYINISASFITAFSISGLISIPWRTFYIYSHLNPQQNNLEG